MSYIRRHAKFPFEFRRNTYYSIRLVSNNILLVKAFPLFQPEIENSIVSCQSEVPFKGNVLTEHSIKGI